MDSQQSKHVDDIFFKMYLIAYSEGRAQLVGKKSVHYKDSGRPMTIQSLDDTGASTNLQSSPSNAHGNTDEDKSNLTGRSSRSSRITNHSSGSLHQSQVSLVSSRRQSGYAMTDNLAPEIAAEDGWKYFPIKPVHVFYIGCLILIYLHHHESSYYNYNVSH